MSRGLPLAGLLALVVLSAAGAEPPTLPDASFPSGPLVLFRSSAGLEMPGRDPALDRLCAARAAELAASGVLTHRDDRGRGPGVQSVGRGYAPGEFGEVLGAGAGDEAVWQAWLASPAHREVLAAPGWTRWGAGRAASGRTQVWVVRFWRP